MHVFDEKYLWTRHSKVKMRHYRLTESRIKRIIRHPTRLEEGVIEGAIAVMQPAGGSKYSEIWVMYIPIKKWSGVKGQVSGVKIITVWRYPGRAPERGPIPPEILREIKNIL
jgi:hypothetical protein